MNHVILSGRLTHDPELVHSSSERAICRMRVAVDNGKYDTTYIDVATFDRQAYACAEHLSKGRKVGVSGRLAYSEWRDDEGKRRERYNIVGRVEFLDRPPSQREAEPAEQPPSPAPEPRLQAVPEPEPQREAEPSPVLPQLALAV
jgi:single-strand DNA-binding protein